MVGCFVVDVGLRGIDADELRGRGALDKGAEATDGAGADDAAGSDEGADEGSDEGSDEGAALATGAGSTTDGAITADAGDELSTEGEPSTPRRGPKRARRIATSTAAVSADAPTITKAKEAFREDDARSPETAVASSPCV